jgi:hypothetical protein
MSFSTELAELVARQLSRFVTLNRYQVAGHVANLEFWLGQVRHALATIDGYGKRFQELKRAQGTHVKEHKTTQFEFDDPCCTQGPPDLPQKVPEAALKEARIALCNAARRFLVRCYREGFVEGEALMKACADVPIGLDRRDLTPSGKPRRK